MNDWRASERAYGSSLAWHPAGSGATDGPGALWVESISGQNKSKVAQDSRSLDAQIRATTETVYADVASIRADGRISEKYREEKLRAAVSTAAEQLGELGRKVAYTSGGILADLRKVRVPGRPANEDPTAAALRRLYELQYAQAYRALSPDERRHERQHALESRDDFRLGALLNLPEHLTAMPAVVREAFERDVLRDLYGDQLDAVTDDVQAINSVKSRLRAAAKALAHLGMPEHEIRGHLGAWVNDFRTSDPVHEIDAQIAKALEDVEADRRANADEETEAIADLESAMTPRVSRGGDAPQPATTT